MNGYDLFTHGTAKSTIAVRLGTLIRETELGLVFIDRARLSCPEADLSVEPDVLLLLVETLTSGRARLIPRAGNAGDRFVEIEGIVDLVVECLSNPSRTKDRGRLPDACPRAGVREYWLVDARSANLDSQVLIHHDKGHVPSPLDADGFVRPEVLGRPVHLLRHRHAPALVFFRLELQQGRRQQR